ncbi:sugar ABC transporter substrate-binding protein [Nocardioidaceae bacterium SCSIO 66511]|nr:sugar ABC transporter substrate-binding protein [Nocardioidaceae bacterium SCSIO 66511]
MKSRLLSVVAVSAAVVGLTSACGGDDGSGDGGKVELRFQSLAWQDASIAANKEIVAEWNDEHPDVQVTYDGAEWDSVHDKLLTAFEGGDPPDIIHYEASAGQVFAEGGYFADLDPLLSDDFKSGIADDVWDTVKYDDYGTVGVPFLMENRLPIANATLLKQAGVKIPTPDDPWTWDEFAAAAKKLTNDDTYGVAFPLGDPANAMVTLSQNFGGEYVADGPEISAGDEEIEVPERIHSMLYDDKSASSDTVSLTSTDALPGFFGGKYAMVFGATWLRQQMVEESPDGFDWVTIPPIEGTEGATQAVNPQTLSVAAQSEHPEEAAEFIEFFLDGQNMARLAEGDWLVPTSDDALDALQKRTNGKQGWDVALASADTLTAAPWRRTPGFQEWMDKIATPAFQKYFGDDIDEDELVSELEDGSDLLSESR